MSDQPELRQLMTLSQKQQTVTFAHGETPVITFGYQDELPAAAMAVNALRTGTCIAAMLACQTNLLCREKDFSEQAARLQRVLNDLQQSNEKIKCTVHKEDPEVKLIVFQVTRTVKK